VIEFLCPSIAEFLNTTDVFKDDKFEEFFASITLKVLQCRATLLYPLFRPLLAPSYVYLVLATSTSYSAWRTNRNKKHW